MHTPPILFYHFLSKGKESVSANGPTDDGSNESIVSSKLAESALLNGIGKLIKAQPVFLQVTFKRGDEAKEFIFFSTRTSLRTTLKIAARLLALDNVTSLVADADLAVEGLLIGPSISQHLGFDTKFLLGERPDYLDGADRSFARAAKESK